MDLLKHINITETPSKIIIDDIKVSDKGIVTETINVINKDYILGQTLLKVENLNISYDKKVLENISFEIKNIIRPNMQQGQIVSIVGKSGCGKTQLFRSIAGLKIPDSGTVQINEKPVRAGDVSVVYQSYPLFNHRTVINNLLIASNNREEIDKWLDIFNLKNHINHYPSSLSGGERQRISIIQQIITGNKFILLDEPFSGLDSIMIDKLTKTIVKASQTDELLTFIIISHDLENSISISDRVIVLNKTTPDGGSTVVAEFDLAKSGLAWTDDIKYKQEFRDLIQQVKDLI